MTFSIIVPVYNVEKYLRKCLDSIINQTNQDFELIIVNDGTTDNSQLIIDDYVEKYPSKVKSFIKENGGLSDARNYGVEKATGEYIIFIDSDDYIDKRLLEKLNEVIIREKNPEIIGFNAQLVYEDERKGIAINKPIFNKLEGEAAMYKFIKEKQYFEPACFYAYNFDFWKKNKFKFEKGRYHEDFGLIPEVILKTKNITTISFTGYYYLQREKSITKANNIIKEKVYDILYFVDKQLIVAEKIKDKRVKQVYDSYVANVAINQIVKLHKEERKQYKQELKKRKIFDKILSDTILRKIKKAYVKVKNI